MRPWKKPTGRDPMEKLIGDVESSMQAVENARNTMATTLDQPAVQISPLDYVLRCMRYHYWNAKRELSRAHPDLGYIHKQMAAGHTYARDAMPYLHPRLSAVQYSGSVDHTVEVRDARERLAHLLAGAAPGAGTAEDPRTTH